MKKNLIAEKEISKLICERGKQINDHVYAMPILKNVIIEFDGRICIDEYEDLSCAAPCIVTCLWADAIKDHVWFAWTINFSTMFPPQCHDNFNLCILGQKQYGQIVEYLNRIPKRRERKKDYKLEWLKLAQSYLDQYNWRSGSDDEECKYSWFKHSVDCWLCCDHNPMYDNIDKIIEDEYINKLDDFGMIALRMIYPNKEQFNEKMYLSHQTLERTVIKNKFIKMVMNKVWDTVTDNFIQKLYKQNPADILKKRYKKLLFEFKDKVVFEKSKEITKPYKHTPLDTYTVKNCTDEKIGLNDLWINASYILVHRKEKQFRDKLDTEYTYSPVILKHVEIEDNIAISEKSFESGEYFESDEDIYDYFSINDYFGKPYVILTLENQKTHEEIKIKWSIYGSYYQDNGYYYLHMHKSPYKYPTVENTYMKNIINEHISKVKSAISGYIHNLHKSNNTIQYKTHNINGKEWTDSINISEGYDWSRQSKTYKYTFKYANILNLIPKGYRLPTSDEVEELLNKYNIKRDNSTIDDNIHYMYIKDINIIDDVHLYWRDAPGIWTSDTLSGELTDPIKIRVNLYSKKKELVKQSYSQNFLLLIKE